MVEKITVPLSTKQVELLLQLLIQKTTELEKELKGTQTLLELTRTRMDHIAFCLELLEQSGGKK